MDVFDYIVVGAGTAGCVVASRLAEGGQRKVLVLEAGVSDRRFWVQLPIGYGRTFNDPRVNWLYEAEPDPALAGRATFWPRGKVLGGSGSINAMVYYRGLPGDFDDWQELGNPGWGFKDVLPFFQETEDRGRVGDAARPARPKSIHVTDVSPDVHPLCQSFIESCHAIGLPKGDFNDSRGEGVGIYQITTRGGLRDSTSRSYLRPELKSKNLCLRLGAHVLKILFESRRAAGVSYQRQGREFQVKAARGVILCGGAVNSPQILQLSGVGDPALLGRHGIDVVGPSPAVGRNLQDHLAVSYFYRSKVPTLNDELVPLVGKMRAALRYVSSRRGVLAMSVNQGGAFVKSDASQPRPNLQLYFNPMSYTTQGPSRRLLNPDPFSAFLLSCNACRPTSRGHIEIRSANPFEAPAIHANYLATERDIAEAMAGVRLLRSIVATAPLANFVEAEMRPGIALQSDAELLQDFRERAWTVFHPVSTCRMGPDPASAVVDASLRVYGVEGLRIIDASVFPTLTSGNTNAPTVMVAEKGAALIKVEECG
jgi:choline dehydrogenase